MALTRISTGKVFPSAAVDPALGAGGLADRQLAQVGAERQRVTRVHVGEAHAEQLDVAETKLTACTRIHIHDAAFAVGHVDRFRFLIPTSLKTGERVPMYHRNGGLGGELGRGPRSCTCLSGAVRIQPPSLPQVERGRLRCLGQGLLSERLGSGLRRPVGSQKRQRPGRSAGRRTSAEAGRPTSW